MEACQKLDLKTGSIQGNDLLIENTEGQNSSRQALVDVFGDGYFWLTVLSFSVSFKPFQIKGYQTTQ